MTPVKVTIVSDLWTTLRLQDECEVFPTLYKIERLRELPATLILPFNFTLKPFIPISWNIKRK